MNQNIKPSPLGRGLSALFGDADSSYQAPKPVATVQPITAAAAPAQPQAVSTTGSRSLNITWLQPGAYQPRRHFDADALTGLTDSIRERGILEPLVVRPLPGAKDSFEIIAGERRWRAAQQAGLHEVPVIVREMTDREALEFGLIENVQRQDLTPLEEAEGYQRLMDEFNHTQEGLAKIIGKSRPHIANMLRILTLPQAVKQLISSGALSMGHARAIIPARDPLALAQEVVKKGLSVRQTEDLAKKHIENRQIHVKRKTTEGTAVDADTLNLEKELERLTGYKVKINTQGKAGSLTLFYKDLDQLDDIIKRLRS